MGDLFGGKPREAFLAENVHWAIQEKAARLTDEQLSEIGWLSFSQQPPALEALTGGAGGGWSKGGKGSSKGGKGWDDSGKDPWGGKGDAKDPWGGKGDGKDPWGGKG